MSESGKRNSKIKWTEEVFDIFYLGRRIINKTKVIGH